MSILGFLPPDFKVALRKRLLGRLGAMDAFGPSAWSWNGDGMATVHNTDFLRDPEFERAYQLGLATGSWNGNEPRFRVYIACWAALQAREVPGDYVECGVNRGGMARAHLQLIDLANLQKNYWLADTFSGFPPEQENLVAEGMSGHTYGECYDDVMKTFAPFSQVRIVRGAVPQVLPEIKAEQVCYLSLDMNCAEPEFAALQFFWPKLSRGALVLMDDYAYKGSERQKSALDEFARSEGIAILGLPTGQGLIVKN